VHSVAPAALHVPCEHSTQALLPDVGYPLPGGQAKTKLTMVHVMSQVKPEAEHNMAAPTKAQTTGFRAILQTVPQML